MDEHGILFVVSTPIGNLEDITLRAVSTLKKSDYIISEDTRTTKKLLNFYNIKTKIFSYHKYSEKKKLNLIINLLLKGKNISLVSEAGTPLISDPGYFIVKECIKRNIKIEVIPGPTSLIPAIILSGFNPEKFLFIGFLPSNNTNKKKEIEKLKEILYPIILFEAPHRLIETLKLIEDVLGNIEIAVIKELTKIHEKVYRGEINQVLEMLENDIIKGEYIIVLKNREILNSNLIEKNLKNEIIKYLKDGKTTKYIVNDLYKKYNINKNKIKYLIYKIKEE